MRPVTIISDKYFEEILTRRQLLHGGEQETQLDTHSSTRSHSNSAESRRNSM